MLKLPPSITLGYREYRVEDIPDEEADKNVGWHYPQKQIIQIDRHRLPPSEVVNTFVHEVLHAIFSVAHYEFASDEDEENTVTCMANGLTAFFKNNPEAIVWIMNTVGADSVQERGL
jgi:hypothetical protein